MLVALVLSLGAHPATAIPVDGQRDTEYGAPLATQTNGYQYGGQAPRGNYCDRSELDALHAYVSPDSVLHVFVTGNLHDWISAIDPAPDFDELFLYLDTREGGQPVLRADNVALPFFPTQGGLAFDTGFEPDWMLEAMAPTLCCDLPAFRLHGYFAELHAAGSTGGALGYNDGSAPGILAGGTNPFDVRLAIDNRSPGAIGPGCTLVGDGGGVTTGIEWAVPLAAIGRPTGCIRMMVYACWRSAIVWNQVLPPVPPGTCSLGPPFTVHFGDIPGQQYASLCSAGVTARRSTWGELKAIYH